MANREEVPKTPNRPEFDLSASRPGFIQVLVIFGDLRKGNPYTMRRQPPGAHDFTSRFEDNPVDLVQLLEVLRGYPPLIDGVEQSSALKLGRGRLLMSREA